MDIRNGRVTMALAVLAVWIVLHVVVSHLSIRSAATLPELLSQGVQPVFAISTLFLFGAMALFRWNDLGLNAPFSGRSLLVLWLPLALIGLLAASIAAAGMPSRQVMVFILINTFLVGLSEELMFRGILFQALRSRLSVWPAILLTSALFGAVHLLNGAWIGSLALSLLQACMAFCTGMLLMAIRIRTRSLDPAILFHAGWDFCLALLAASPQLASAARPEVTAGAVAAMGIYATIVLFYSVFMLRHAGRAEPEEA